jgi:TldD protein
MVARPESAAPAHEPLATAERLLLAPAGLDLDMLGRLIAQIMGPSVEGGELYFQLSRDESWSLEDARVKDASHSLDRGVGVRALAGERTGLAYSDEISAGAIEESARAARAIVRGGASLAVRGFEASAPRALYAAIDPIDTVADAEKVAFLELIDRQARRLDARVKQVMASLVGAYDVILVANSDGLLAADVRPLVRLNVSVVLESGDKREQGYAGMGGRYSLAELLASPAAALLPAEAVHAARVNLEAVAAPAGPMTVVLGAGWPGVMLHEAVGHPLEGDFNRKGVSAFSGRMGQKVASHLCTVVDDGTLPRRRGSLSVDDEGTPTQCTTLIDKGVLVGYMQDRQNARLMGQKPTGNGRRESFAHPILPRMTNTYMRAGPHDPEEIIRSVQKGLYAVNFGGGQVDTTSGKFVFSASEAYLIEQGRVTRPVKGATLIGSGPEVLNRVSMLGHDLKLDAGVGSCGKEGQTVPVGVGQPTVKVDSLTVGGTA